MHLLDGDLVLSATDLTRFLACRHLTALDQAAALGEGPHAPQPDEALEVVLRRGLAHEADYLERLRTQGRTIAEITVAPGAGPAELIDAERRSVEAMAAGVDVVYQATLYDGRWRGHADFLLRSDERAGRWPWSYDVADTKLARRLKVAALLQMATYGRRLAELQGVQPQWLTVLAGDGTEQRYRYQDCAAYAGRLRAALEEFLRQRPATRPEPVRHCPQCRWQPHCAAQWRAQDDLTLVASLRGTQARLLGEAGIRTVRELAAASPDQLPPRIGEAARQRLVAQAGLQIAERDSGRPSYQLLAPQPGRGLATLPAPSAGDLFFDIEGDPFESEHGLEYLWGVTDDQDRYTAFWATEPALERQAFEQLVDHLIAAWRRDPGMHVYHYASYEPERLKELSGRYDSRVAEVDRLLRGQRLVDLYAVVKQALRVSKESYSIKQLEDFYWGHRHRAETVSDALGSMVAFERWLTGGGDGLLADIAEYNEVDCRSTRALRDWLEERRTEAGGDALHPRPVHTAGAPSPAAQQAAGELAELRAALLARRDPGSRLLAGLLDWHRREALPQWWDWFRRLAASPEELIGDPGALGGLGPPVEAGRRGRSVLWQMEFPPQETRLGPGEQTWLDPAARGHPVVEEIRPDEGLLLLRRATHAGPPVCTALIPPPPILDTVLRDRLRELAEWVLAHGPDDPGPGWRAARDLLRRRAPVLPSGPDASAVVLRAGRELRAGVLAVQGPPGTGKTHTAARLILELVGQGRRVGVCAFSHAAIGALLAAVASAAAEQGSAPRILQKADPRQRSHAPGVQATGSAAAVETALAQGEVDVVAGTAWLLARPGLRDRLDVLVVDEAGQLSLANVLAVSQAAPALVLLGDPQQLAQPVLGSHPPGAAASALGHLLDGQQTMPPDLGVLLDVTHRMHPEIAGFVSSLSYQGRVRSAPGCERQRVLGSGPLAGAGLRWLPVEPGERSASAAEADTVRQVVEQVLDGGRWRDPTGAERKLRPSDILVLGLSNTHVHRVRARLGELAGPGGVRVGTVDRFQGQQAATVVYTLGVTTPGRGPHGLRALLDRHRLTVALSRARAVATVVANPALLSAPVADAVELALVNDLCTFVALAERSDSSGVLR